MAEGLVSLQRGDMPCSFSLSGRGKRLKVSFPGDCISKGTDDNYNTFCCIRMSTQSSLSGVAGI